MATQSVKGAAVRACAAEVVSEVAHGGASLDALLESKLARVAVRDHALFRELCSGTLRWYWYCHGIVAQRLARPLRRRDRVIEALLALGVYQFEHTRLPAHAVIHGSVAACGNLGRPGYRRLVNGVLRNIQRQDGALREALPEAARRAHPDWLWAAIVEQWPARAPDIAAAGNQRPPMSLRVNTRQGPVEDYLAALGEAGLKARTLAHAPQALTLDRPVSIDRLPGFDRGRVSVQDASAQLLTQLIAPRPGARLLDACAAPGGKLTHMLEQFPGVAMQALESQAARAPRIRENLERLGLAARLAVADAGVPEAWWDGAPFDIVVLDAPCSGSGVLRRHPDIKVLRRASDVERFAAQQARLLDRLWPLVKPGGLMVYVTCSILAAENQAQIGAFLARVADAREQPFELPVGQALRHGWQILPEIDGGDGFYYARIVRA